MFNRKLFWRTLAVLTIAESCLLLCACGDWETQAINIISLLNPAIMAVLNILAALGVSVAPGFMTAFNSWASQAQAALVNVKSLISQYKNAAASAQPGILNQIDTGLQTIAGNLQTILPELHIDNADHQQRVAAALQAIIGFVAAIQNLLPAVKPQLSEKEAVSLHAKAQDTVKVFKTEFNNAVAPFGEEYELN